MSEPTVAPYGTWRSPISAAMLVEGGVRLGHVSIEEGSVYWVEGRPAEGGRSVVVRRDAGSEPADVTPEGFNARTTVHEYGGGAYVVHRGVVFSSNFADQRLYRQERGGAPAPITPDTGGRSRYADGRVTSDGSLLICVRERHEEEGVINELVAIPTDGSSDASIVVDGYDFFSTPRISPDGTKLAWLAWNLPYLPWDGSELWVADLDPAGVVSGRRLVAGRLGEESIFQPEWSPDGVLHFVSDRTDWWNLYREIDGEVQSICPMDAEFGWPQWVFGLSSYAFLDDGRMACIWNRDGTQHVAVIDPRSGELLDLDLPYDAIGAPWVAAEGQSMVFIGASASIPAQVVSLDFLSRSIDVLKESEDDHGGRRVPLRAPGDRVPDRGRSHRPRVLLPAGEQGLHGAARRAAPAHRAEPRRSDVGGVRRVRYRAALLDEPWFRGRRRQLRREHRLRTRVPRAVVRKLGRRRHRGLHQRRPVPGGSRRGRRGSAADRRRQCRGLHHALRADVPRRLRGRRELLRHLGPGAVREARRHAQVRVAGTNTCSWARTRKRRISTGPGRRSTSWT